MLKLHLDSIIIWLSPNSMLPLRPVNFWVINFRLGYITKYEFSFVNHAPFNHKAAGWPSSAFYPFTRAFRFVSKPVLILLFTLYLLRLFYIINSISFSPSQILPWRIFSIFSISWPLFVLSFKLLDFVLPFFPYLSISGSIYEWIKCTSKV